MPPGYPCLVSFGYSLPRAFLIHTTKGLGGALEMPFLDDEEKQNKTDYINEERMRCRHEKRMQKKIIQLLIVKRMLRGKSTLPDHITMTILKIL